MTTAVPAGRAAGRRLTAALREGESVTPLELFFDLVFVLALTQCTALMADQPTWEGMARGVLVLAALWWSWVGYAWLTSVVDPEEGAVRLAIFVVMAAFLVAALCVPEVFDHDGWAFAGAYAVVRAGQIFLFVVASRDDARLRRSVVGLAGSTALGCGLILAAAAVDGRLQGALFALALSLDVGGPYLFGAQGWKLVPGHFAERHGLIVIIALGESIVAIGAGVEHTVDAGVVGAAVLGMAAAAAMWWLYFDVASLAAERRLMAAAEGRERNEMARDAYSLLHFPMVAGIVLFALGTKKTLGHVGDELDDVAGFALAGGVAAYLLAHVALRWRVSHTLSRQRLAAAVLALALWPVVLEVPAIAGLALLAALLTVLAGYETVRFAESRERTRHELNERAVSG